MVVEGTYDRSTQDVGNILLIEHEVRSAAHPMFQRPLVNRNTAQSL